MIYFAIGFMFLVTVLGVIVVARILPAQKRDLVIIKDIENRRKWTEFENAEYLREVVIDVDLDGKRLEVHRRYKDFPYPPYYEVVVDGDVKHPDCSPEDALRALGHYIHSLSHKVSKKEE